MFDVIITLVCILVVGAIFKNCFEEKRHIEKLVNEHKIEHDREVDKSRRSTSFKIDTINNTIMSDFGRIEKCTRCSKHIERGLIIESEYYCDRVCAIDHVNHVQERYENDLHLVHIARYEPVDTSGWSGY